MVDLEAIRKRADAATAGPWRASLGAPSDPALVEDGDGTCDGRWICDVYTGTSTDGIITRAFRGVEIDDERHAHNAEFIAHAREDVPALLDLVTERDATIADLQRELAEWRRQARESRTVT